ncbi:c-type cytochrome [Thiohalomonas denitrificans]|uniref:Sulfide dehydrogenase (Flavocytochrome c), cytochrome c subunit n=1 Tax=Thiohalomonas denitrificans TaxID=415747 RepID=A0A1G5QNH1_9GAMM|nr:c-type cytochrome [Thiohalomonas denitrificans]SCZ63395.1 sulfide dehydrogenase (flavocytochrome c), cytochrome c subunit [Thiohalomonas denitrificans]
MKYKKVMQGALVLTGFAFGASALAATPSASMLGNSCAGCHGPNGNTEGPATPGIAGISSEYFVDVMMDYKADERPGTIMNRIAKGYTDEEIELMASYFTAQEYVPLEQEYNASAVRLGEMLHDRSCEKCHEDGGTFAEDSAILAGQPKLYLQWSMADFQAGVREMPKKMKRRMDEVEKVKGDEGFNALVDYYASQGK